MAYDRTALGQLTGRKQIPRRLPNHAAVSMARKSLATQCTTESPRCKSKIRLSFACFCGIIPPLQKSPTPLLDASGINDGAAFVLQKSPTPLLGYRRLYDF
jgi:hypothetical protein